MIKTFTGPMHSGKTEAMLDVYRKIYNKDHIKCFKPRIDVRDKGIKSKVYEEEIPAILINKFEDILSHMDESVSIIFIDEAQMLEGNIGVLSYLSIARDIDIYVGGLNQTSEQEPFLVMPQILAISDEVSVIKASCFDCGRDEATHTYFSGEKTEAIKVGDEGYMPLCPRCLLKRRGSEGLKKILIYNRGSKKEENV